MNLRQRKIPENFLSNSVTVRQIIQVMAMKQKKEVKAVSLDGECRRREVRVNTEEAMFMGG